MGAVVQRVHVQLIIRSDHRAVARKAQRVCLEDRIHLQQIKFLRLLEYFGDPVLDLWLRLENLFPSDSNRLLDFCVNLILVL